MSNKEKEGQKTVETVEKIDEIETDFGKDFTSIRAGDEVRQGVNKAQKDVEVINNPTNVLMR